MVLATLGAGRLGQMADGCWLYVHEWGLPLPGAFRTPSHFPSLLDCVVLERHLF